jgi:general stress protein YciG
MNNNDKQNHNGQNQDHRQASGSENIHGSQVEKNPQNTSSNRGNFANDPDRAREAGRKGGQS